MENGKEFKEGFGTGFVKRVGGEEVGIHRTGSMVDGFKETVKGMGKELFVIGSKVMVDVMAEGRGFDR